MTGWLPLQQWLMYIFNKVYFKFDSPKHLEKIMCVIKKWKPTMLSSFQINYKNIVSTKQITQI